MTHYKWAHEDEIDITVKIDWSIPVTHDMLDHGLADSDESAYFYSIIARVDGGWWPFYIGMVYEQCISQRHKDQDHIKRLEILKKEFPDHVWHITLGTPKFIEVQKSKKLIESVEGLLIYSNWHEEMINKKCIEGYYGDQYLMVINEGFNDPFYAVSGFGAFRSNDEE